MRGISIIFSLVMFVIVGGISWYYMRQGMEQAREMQEKAAKQVDEAHKKAADPDDGVPEEARPIHQALEKNRHYIECFNRLESRRRRAMERYFSWVVDLEAGPTGKERRVNGIYEISGLDDCRKKIGEAAQVKTEMKELLELQKLMYVYVDGAEKLVDVVDKMYRYYNDEDYKDDDFAKAKEFHKELMKLHAQVEPLGRKFEEMTDGIQDTLNNQRLEFFKKQYGEEIRYLLVRTSMAARHLIDVVESDKDPEKVAGALNEFEEIQDKLADYFEKNETKIKEEIYKDVRGGTSNVERYMRGTREMVTMGKRYSRALAKAAENPRTMKRFVQRTFTGGGEARRLIQVFNRDVASVSLPIPW